MTPDEIIDKALRGGGMMIGGPETYILEGNPERNLFRIITTDEAFKNNLAAFTWDVRHGFIFMGMFTTRDAAEQMEENIRAMMRDEDGNPLIKL